MRVTPLAVNGREAIAISGPRHTTRAVGLGRPVGALGAMAEIGTIAGGVPSALERTRAAQAEDAGDARDETTAERIDRNLEELTGELRVVVTGVQVLFAFLLVVPFDSGFEGIGSYERGVYFATLILAALAAACVIAPSAQHRFLFRQDDKDHLVLVSNRVVIVGLACLALAMCGALLLVATKLFGALAGAITVVLGSAPFIALWFAMPIWRRHTLAVAQLQRVGPRHGPPLA